MSTKTSLGCNTVLLYPVKKFSSSFTFLVFPSINNKIDFNLKLYSPKITYTLKPNLIIVLLYIERKKWKSCFRFFTDGKQHKARELDMITRDLECP